MRRDFLIKVAIALTLLGFVVAVVSVYRAKPWLPGLLLQQMFQEDQAAMGKQPVDLIFIFVDHYEPHHIASVERWEKMYPRLVKHHKDADGKVPQHTFFWYWADDRGEITIRNLSRLAQLAYEGYGEVELHLHHDNDTSLTLTKELERRIKLSQRTGAFMTAEEKPKTRYAFIHGMWALDNSRGGKFCGVNNELEILRKSGCYADFTHSSWGTMTPVMTNSIYYAKDDPARPKSYDQGKEVEVGGKSWGDLLIFEGPSIISFEKGKFRYDHGDVTVRDLPTPERIDRWVRTAIHVKGRPEWIFVKVFTHGAIAHDHEALLGKWAEKMYDTLEKKYNDGKRYRLHYATAREAYNIVKAAEAGRSGNPNNYRDFVIPPYANEKIAASLPYQLVSYAPRHIEIISSANTEGHFHFKEGVVAEIHGHIARILVDMPRDEKLRVALQGEGVAWVKMRGNPTPFRADLFKEETLQ